MKKLGLFFLFVLTFPGAKSQSSYHHSIRLNVVGGENPGSGIGGWGLSYAYRSHAPFSAVPGIGIYKITKESDVGSRTIMTVEGNLGINFQIAKIANLRLTFYQGLQKLTSYGQFKQDWDRINGFSLGSGISLWRIDCDLAVGLKNYFYPYSKSSIYTFAMLSFGYVFSKNNMLTPQ